jgi:hypothetical protein
MNKLCCLISPQFVCEECHLHVCDSCWRLLRHGSDEYNYVLWHERDGKCPGHADECTHPDGSPYIFVVKRS